MMEVCLNYNFNEGLLQVRDYRNCSSEPGIDVPSANSPVVSKVRLRMSLENVVKDIPLISNDAWTYGDLMVSMNCYFCP